MWSYISDWWKTTLYHLLVRKRSIMYQSWHHCKLYCSNMYQHEIWCINLTLWWHWLCDLTEIACALSVLIDDTYISFTLVFSNLIMFYFHYKYFLLLHMSNCHSFSTHYFFLKFTYQVWIVSCHVYVSYRYR